MKLGLVGYPQVGKKTLFTLLTGQSPASGSKGAAMGLAAVRDVRFDRLVTLFKPKRETPAVIDFALLPDLDLDAERNAEALSALESVDVICHLVRAFAADSVYHVAGEVDPQRDLRAFADELQLNDLLFVEKRLQRIEKEGKGKKDPRLLREAELLQRMRDHLEADQPLSEFPLSEEESRLLASYPLLTRKAVINALNVDEEQVTHPSLQADLQQTFASLPHEWITVSAQIEEELGQLEPEERQEFLQEMGLEQPALERLTRLCYRTLGLISFFTVGEDEVRAWTIPRGALAPQAGRAIHTDIERGFIRAEVMRCDDLLELGSEARVRDAGKLLPKGRDYVVQDGDVLHFLFKV